MDTTKSGTIAVTVTGGGSGDTVPVILNTVFIGTATTGNYSGKHFYIGNARTTNNTPSSVYSMAGYNLHLGSDWDNTPSWKSNIEYMISGYQLKKNNVLVSYTDLPDYNGTGARNNRNQHYVFSVATISTGNKIPVPVPTGNKIPVPAPTTNTETYFGRPGSDLGDEYYDYFISALNTGKWTYTTSFSEGKGVWTDSFQWVYYRAQKRLSVALCRTTDTGFTIYTINNVEETDLNY
ncbi:hypothetical protein AGMMS49942_24950 [Spirochaetia bacterium]|nr:hypothetical protein AGMMS49942_24950 [Spirochaetia bacterium]